MALVLKTSGRKPSGVRIPYSPPVIETHPFGNFVPPNARYLFLGTFVVKITDPSYDWFFSSKRNQFWQIMDQVYGVELKNKKEKQELFSKLKMAITDIILTCERSQNTNADNNLINLVFNTRSINEIVKKNIIKKIFFSITSQAIRSKQLMCRLLKTGRTRWFVRIFSYALKSA